VRPLPERAYTSIEAAWTTALSSQVLEVVAQDE